MGMQRHKPRLSTEEYQLRTDLGFALLEELAEQGKRCPQSSGPGRTVEGYIFRGLIKQGRILNEISGRNWRRITILVGPQAGKQTAPNPDKLAKVWMTMDASGTRLHGRPMERPLRARRPSAPRALTAAELE